MVLVKHRDVWLVEKVLQQKGTRAKVKWFGFEGPDAIQWIDLKDIT